MRTLLYVSREEMKSFRIAGVGTGKEEESPKDFDIILKRNLWNLKMIFILGEVERDSSDAFKLSGL